MLLDELAEERLVGLAKSLGHGDAWALWAGAGLSAAAGLPGWTALVEEAAVRFGVDIPTNANEIEPNAYPGVLSRCLQAAPSDIDFWTFVTARLCRDTPAAVHDLVSSLPFELYLTTNYDLMLERGHARREVPEPRVVAYPDVNVRFINSGRLIYLHGRCVCDGSGDPLDDQRVVLTERSYEEAYEENRSPLSALLQLILAHFSVLFVGASLSDWPQWRLMETARHLRDATGGAGGSASAPRHFAITSGPSSAIGPAADDTFKGTRFGILPIFYKLDASGGHSAVELILQWLTSNVARPGSAFKVAR